MAKRSSISPFVWILLLMAFNVPTSGDKQRSNSQGSFYIYDPKDNHFTALNASPKQYEKLKEFVRRQRQIKFKATYRELPAGLQAVMDSRKSPADVAAESSTISSYIVVNDDLKSAKQLSTSNSVFPTLPSETYFPPELDPTLIPPPKIKSTITSPKTLKSTDLSKNLQPPPINLISQNSQKNNINTKIQTRIQSNRIQPPKLLSIEVEEPTAVGSNTSPTFFPRKSGKSLSINFIPPNVNLSPPTQQFQTFSSYVGRSKTALVTTPKTFNRNIIVQKATPVKIIKTTPSIRKSHRNTLNTKSKHSSSSLLNPLITNQKRNKAPKDQLTSSNTPRNNIKKKNILIGQSAISKSLQPPFISSRKPNTFKSNILKSNSNAVKSLFVTTPKPQIKSQKHRLGKSNTDKILNTSASSIDGKIIPLSQRKSNRVGSIPGKADVDYPSYLSIPETNFKCSQYTRAGYYADVETRCQVFHACWENRKASFLCPVGTIFSHKVLTCDWWYNSRCSPDEITTNYQPDWGVPVIPGPGKQISVTT